MASDGIEQLRSRTKRFALDVIRLTEALPRNRVADVVARQLLRSGTSVAANYRAACRAKSAADFISKMSIVEEEADESQFWLEILAEASLLPSERLTRLTSEANQLISIVVASKKTARRNLAS